MSRGALPYADRSTDYFGFLGRRIDDLNAALVLAVLRDTEPPEQTSMLAAGP